MIVVPPAEREQLASSAVRTVWSGGFFISTSPPDRRIVTNSDLDALVACVLLKRVEPVGSIKYLPLERLRTGDFSSVSTDIVVNMPYIPGCGLWFDHHASNEPPEQYAGRYRPEAPSAARVVYDHYVEREGQHVFDGLEELLAETDRVDDARFRPEDILEPRGTVLLSFLIPAHPLKEQAVSENNLMVSLLDSGDPQTVLDHPVFRPAAEEFLDRLEESKPVLRDQLDRRDGVMVLDYRTMEPGVARLCDNKFLPFVLYPDDHTLMRIKPLNDDRVKVTLGFNMFLDPSRCPTHYGHLMARYEGGGHRRAAGCSLARSEADEHIEEILQALLGDETVAEKTR